MRRQLSRGAAETSWSKVDGAPPFSGNTSGAVRLARPRIPSWVLAVVQWTEPGRVMLWSGLIGGLIVGVVVMYGVWLMVRSFK